GRVVWLGYAQVVFRYADGGREPRPVVPGMPLAVHVQFYPMDALVAAGHRLVLSISQANFDDRMPATTPGPWQLEVGAEKTSLELPTVPRTAPDFLPPWQVGSEPEGADGVPP
ncbi:MAG: CocE/NonD family hydrolase C-terminal non-catalytic domain-containing protein, partial [Methanobacteriota archaeon]